MVVYKDKEERTDEINEEAATSGAAKKRGKPKKVTAKKRGRPTNSDADGAPKKKGRPRKTDADGAPKKKGRPRKTDADGAPKKRGRPRKTDATLKACTPLPKRKSEPSQWVQSPFTEGKTDEVEGQKKKLKTNA